MKPSSPKDLKISETLENLRSIVSEINELPQLDIDVLEIRERLLKRIEELEKLSADLPKRHDPKITLLMLRLAVREIDDCHDLTTEDMKYRARFLKRIEELE